MYLLDCGADIDARDVDHESTPAQYMVKERQDVARYLVTRGCRTDLLMATALGDLDLARRHLDVDPGCIRMRVNDEFFPMVNPRAGGTIYQWTLGFHVSAHQVARKFGHQDVLTLLLERTPVDARLIDACWMADEPTVQAIRREHPGIVESLSEGDRRQVAHAARNNQSAAVRLMLECGWPVDATRSASSDAAALGRVSRQRRDGGDDSAFQSATRGNRRRFQWHAAPMGNPWIRARVVLPDGRLRRHRRDIDSRWRQAP